MCCVVEQHEGGVNPTESMTRALISDDSIARQSTLGPVQLGYVSTASDLLFDNFFHVILFFCFIFERLSGDGVFA